MPSADRDRRNIVGINAETVTNVTSTNFPGHWPGEDNSWNLQKFCDTFQVEFTQNTSLHSEFDLIHLDAAIANAFRRIMMAEVPSFAIETCYVLDNTSVIQDEVLAQRLGLVPLCGSQEGMKGMKWFRGRGTMGGAVAGAGAGAGAAGGAVSLPTIYDTLILHLEVYCERSPDDGSPTVPAVYARDIEWRPASGQGAWFGDDPVRAVYPDIVLAKLRPGQGMTVTMHAVKGLGKDHAKFSPVATASYRLLPTIEIVGEKITGKAAERFAACFPEGVVEIVDGEAKVVGARKDTVSREVLRHEEFRGRVELGRVMDHFIFSVESVGQWDADAIFLESVGVLQAKVNRLKRHAMRMLQLEAEKEDRETSIADEEDQMEEEE